MNRAFKRVHTISADSFYGKDSQKATNEKKDPRVSNALPVASPSRKDMITIAMKIRDSGRRDWVATAARKFNIPRSTMRSMVERYVDRKAGPTEKESMQKESAAVVPASDSSVPPTQSVHVRAACMSRANWRFNVYLGRSKYS